jgi:VCBS repeat-containing protein
LVLERLEDRRLLTSGSEIGWAASPLDAEPADAVSDPAPVADPLFSEGGGSAAPEAGPSAAPYPLADTFLLHSYSAATKTLYLDFDGHTTSGTIWNNSYGDPILTPAFSFEGDTSFSAAEKERIQYIWQRVAEDFLPFEVDVTTEDPGVEALRQSGAGDAEWGLRIVIGPESWYPGTPGGVAYDGSFNWSTDTPAFVFSDNLGNDEKYVAEAISHEAGHALGLGHDGTSSATYYAGHGSGVTGWAPIMGNSYYQELSQWSKGEYPDANNTQDDLQIITTSNGFGYRGDDHGNEPVGADALNPTGGTILSATGIIEQNSDVDYFYFATGTGAVSLDVDPSDRSPNLDVLATLYDHLGNVIATSNPTDQLDASFSLTLAAGTYLLKVDGTGQDPLDTGYSDYGSLGYYSILGSVPLPGNVPPVVLGVAPSTSSSLSGANVSLDVTFSEPVVGVDATDMVLSNSAAGSASVGTPTNIGGNTWRFPVQGLVTGTLDIELAPDANDIEDVDGNDLDPSPTTFNYSVGIRETIYSAPMTTDPGWTLDAGSGNYKWQWGTPTGGGGVAQGNPDPTAGHTGASVLGYNLSGDYPSSMATQWAQTPAIDVSQFQNVQLSYYRWLNVESFSYDQAVVQVSNDGVSWTTIWQNPDTTLTDSSWTLQTFDISSVADQQATVYVRFGMGTTDSSWEFSGWNLDDVELSGVLVVEPSVNHEPAGTDKTVTVPEDDTYTVAVSDFGFTDPNDSPAHAFLGVLITTLPAAGSLQLSGVALTAGQFVTVSDINAGRLTFMPGVEANGIPYTSFTFQVKDRGGTLYGGVDLDSTPNQLTFDVTPVNDEPVRTAGTLTPVSVNEDSANSTAVSLGLSGVSYGPGGGADEASQTLTYTLTAVPSSVQIFKADGTTPVYVGGTVTAAELQGLMFKTVPNGSGTGSLTWTVTDNGSPAQTLTETLAITVVAANDAPTAANDTYTVAEDTVLNVAAAGVLANDSDADGDPLTAVLVSGPAHGTLTLNANGSFLYTPASNYNGSDSFSYKANDGTVDSNTATVTITISAVNDAPTAVNDAYTVAEDTPLNVAAAGVLANDSDVEGSPLTAVLVSGPAHGTLTLNANGSFIYTPAANFNGSDSFSYQANDVSLNSNTATVTVTVSAVDDAPTAVNDAYTVAEDTPLNVAAAGVLANDGDADGNPLTAVLVSGPAHGTLTLNANGSFSYTPAGNFYGSDSFTYQANDGSLNSSPATVTITVNAVNDPPTVVNDAYTVAEDTVLNVAAAGVLANDSDVEGSPLTAVLVSGPAHGTLTLNANGSFTYTPAANFSGSDSFTYQANDGSLNSNPATVTITVSAVNDAPTAVNDAYTVAEGALLNVVASGVLANDGDVDGDPLTAVLVSGPAHGTLTLNANGSFTYTPAANFQGTDNFTYQGNDGSLYSNTATVTITVSAVNDPPTAVNDAYLVAEDTLLNVAAAGVLANDSDPEGSPLAAALVSGPAHGTLTLNADGSFTYAPAANFNGSDSFTYKANDGSLDSNTATVTITVSAVNDPPTAVNDAYTVAEDTLLNVAAAGVLANDSDVEGSPLTAVLVSGPTHGTLTLNANGSFTYLPAANFNGSDSFTYQANDGSLNSNPATVTITVSAVSDPPTAANDAYTVAEDTLLDVVAAGVLANDSDPEGNPLTAVLVSGPAHGALILNANGSFTYTPAANFNGGDSFTYRAHGSLDSSPATVTITVSAVNDAPSAVNNAFTVAEDTVLNVAAAGVLANDSDPDGDPLAAVLVSDPAHGALTINANGSFSYVPAANYFGSDSFTYRASDGNLNSNLATVTITVTAVNDPPTVVNDAYTVAAGTLLNVAAASGVLANDSDVEGSPLTVALVSAPAHGTLMLNATGSFMYMSLGSFEGTDTFTYKVNDGSLNSSPAIVTIAVDSQSEGATFQKLFDFGTPKSPVEAGYSQVTQGTQYAATLGYGWVAGRISGKDRESGTACDRDLNLTSSGRFVVDVPVGTYVVNLRVGDRGKYAHDLMGFSLEGTTLEAITTAAYQTVDRSYIVSVADGQLTLDLYDLGGKDKSVAIVALGVTAVPAESAPLTVSVNTAAGQFSPSTTSEVAFDVLFSEPVRGFTVSDVLLSGLPLGASASVTGRGATYQVVVRGLTGGGTITASIPAGVVDGLSGVTNAASTTDGNSASFLTPQARFDFGTSRSPVAAGYRGVTDKTVYASTLGSGWSAGKISSADRRTASALDRDLNLTAAGTFVVDVANGSYLVDIRLGDSGKYARDNMAISVEDSSPDVVSTAAQQLLWRRYEVEVTDGQLTVRLTDLGGVNNLVAIAGLLLTPAPLQAPAAEGEQSRNGILANEVQGPAIGVGGPPTGATPNGTAAGSNLWAEAARGSGAYVLLGEVPVSELQQAAIPLSRGDLWASDLTTMTVLSTCAVADRQTTSPTLRVTTSKASAADSVSRTALGIENPESSGLLAGTFRPGTSDLLWSSAVDAVFARGI